MNLWLQSLRDLPVKCDKLNHKFIFLPKYHSDASTSLLNDKRQSRIPKHLRNASDVKWTAKVNKQNWNLKETEIIKAMKENNEN